jgi:GFO/IDH/MocA oxidoreductase family protein
LPEQTKRVRGLGVTAHSRNFFDCVRSRRQTAAHADVMRRSHIACHAAAIAWVLNHRLKFDPAKEEFVGDAEANLLRSRPERDWA